MVEELQMPQRGPRGVRDVPAEQFIRAYAEHLKANDKVGRPIINGRAWIAAPRHMMATATVQYRSLISEGLGSSFKTISDCRNALMLYS